MAKVGLTLDEGQFELESLLESYKEVIMQIRTGVASLDMVRDIKVEAYGTQQKLEHIATISIMSAQTLTIKPFDMQMIRSLGETITAARKDYNVVVKQDQILINIPPLTEETRQEYVRLLKDKTENFRQKMRDIRHRMRDWINDQKEGMPEDDYHRTLEQIDKTTSQYSDELEKMYQKKSQDILTV